MIGCGGSGGGAGTSVVAFGGQSLGISAATVSASAGGERPGTGGAARPGGAKLKLCGAEGSRRRDGGGCCSCTREALAAPKLLLCFREAGL